MSGQFPPELEARLTEMLAAAEAPAARRGGRALERLAAALLVLVVCGSLVAGALYGFVLLVRDVF